MTTIAQERTRLTNVGMRHRRREQWGSTFNYTTARSVVEPATRVFIHISVTNPGNYNSFDAHARGIEAIGRSRFPATGISYNRLFMAGTRAIYEAQPIGRRGAHTVNDFKRSTCSTPGCPGRGTSLTAPSWNLNIVARAYVYASNVQFSVPDHVVDDMARAIVADHRAGFITWSAAHNLHGHRCVSSKSCPGDRVWARMGELHDLIHRYRDNGLPGTPPPPKEDVMTPAQMAELKAYIDARTDPKRVLEVSLKPDTNEPRMSQWAWNRIPQDWNPRVAKILGYILGDTRAALAELGALREVVGKILDRDPSHPLTRADLDDAIEQGMRKVRVEVAVVDDDEES